TWLRTERRHRLREVADCRNYLGALGVTFGVKDVLKARCMTRGFIVTDCFDATKTDTNVVPALEKTFLRHRVKDEGSSPAGLGNLYDELFHVNDDEARRFFLHNG